MGKEFLENVYGFRRIKEELNIIQGWILNCKNDKEKYKLIFVLNI